MQILIRKLSEWAYRDGNFAAAWRARRMSAFLKLMNPPKRARIIDLGGSEYNWRLFPNDFHVTLVNLPGFNPPPSDPERFAAVEADACDLSAVFADGCADIVFSNSVIEHVGGPERQAAFAAEVRRLAPAWWIQTPAEDFPIEAHTGVPFWWSLPQGVRDWMNARWRVTLPAWHEMIEQTTVLSQRRMAELFPEGRIYEEWVFGVRKSLSAFRPVAKGAAAAAASPPPRILRSAAIPTPTTGGFRYQQGNAQRAAVK